MRTLSIYGITTTIQLCHPIQESPGAGDSVAFSSNFLDSGLYCKPNPQIPQSMKRMLFTKVILTNKIKRIKRPLSIIDTFAISKRKKIEGLMGNKYVIYRRF